MNLLDMLKRHEGFRAHPYVDTVGKVTIGYGRNLDDKGLTLKEAESLLINDILEATKDLQRNCAWYNALDPVRKDVVINMVFNMGLPKVLGFQKMIAAIGRHDYEEAAKEMLDSKWAMQVKGRAKELATMMREGAVEEMTE